MIYDNLLVASDELTINLATKVRNTFRFQSSNSSFPTTIILYNNTTILTEQKHFRYIKFAQFNLSYCLRKLLNDGYGCPDELTGRLKCF